MREAMQQLPTITDQQMISDRLAGATYRELAEKYGLDKSTICRRLSKEECQEVIQAGINQQISLIPKANDVIKDTLEQTEDKGLRLKAASMVMDNTGISPARTSSSIINISGNAVISPQIQAIIQSFGQSIAMPIEDMPQAPSKRSNGESEVIDVGVND